MVVIYNVKMTLMLFSLLVQLLPSLHEAGRNFASDVDLVNSILSDTATALTNEFSRSMQVHIVSVFLPTVQVHCWVWSVSYLENISLF